MITIRKDGFYQIENQAHVPCIGIETDRMQACVEGIKRLDAKGIFCSPYHRFHANNLAFLKSMPMLEAVLLRDTQIADVNAIYDMAHLTYFRCNHKRPPMDFGRLQTLKTLVLEPVPRDKGVGALTQLEALHVWHYRPRTRDFSLLGVPSSLVECHLNWVNIESIDALPALLNLKRLELHHCKSLKDLDFDRSRFPALEHIVVHGCLQDSDDVVEAARRTFDDMAYARIEETEEH
ncbi:Uncharacterised protein [BD1-7 clade bacterium]|uniref:Internalin-A n=1 Tax=BD1-7 clade bacterium TaxID=2029982 RepID=A0A5S9Q4N6_9GAMM|nr:Uncharacterised protein [BD1-7 clade bacterium]CAA0112627.1 Uncharacterised protein [BD1-7 clade bacterium]